MSKANRPIFLPNNKRESLIEIRNIDFEWHMGMQFSQKVKNMKSFHSSAQIQGIYPILEISTRSDETLGNNLSAFNLKLKYNDKLLTVESAYQGSKVFESGGPFVDLYNLPGKEIKSDTRLKECGKIIGFDFMGEKWAIEPKTAFYDWLYLTALIQNENLYEGLFKYKGFTDIAFNPKKSINCQARSTALFVSLFQKGYLPKIINDKKLFIEIMEKFNPEKQKQQKLF